MIAILDYGIGNLKSIYNMFKKIGIESKITSNINDIKYADKFILPGVGSFDYGIISLKQANFFDTLEREILENKKPILGICLGMQLIGHSSEEGKEKGLGWIDAKTIKFDLSCQCIPHMGWNIVDPSNYNSIFKNLDNNKFYFVHSYHMICNNLDNVLSITNYENKFVSSINKDNIYGVQFHPEKSHKFGMQLLKNFGEL